MAKRPRTSSRPRFTSTDAASASESPRVEVPGQLPLVEAPASPSLPAAPEPPPAPPAPADFDHLVSAAVRARSRAERAELEVVRAGRAAGISWDRIGARLDRPGETLRRHHARALLDRDDVVPVPVTAAR